MAESLSDAEEVAPAIVDNNDHVSTYHRTRTPDAASAALRSTSGHWSVVEDARARHGVEPVFEERPRDVLRRPGAATPDHRDADAIAHRPEQRMIEPPSRTFRIHGRDQNFPRTQRLCLLDPVEDVHVGPLPAIVRQRFPLRGAAALRLHRQDDALTAERPCRLANEIRPLDRGGIDGNLVGTTSQGVGDVLNRADTAPYGKRHEYVACRFLDDAENVVASVKRRNRIHIEDLIDARLVITPRERPRLADDAQAFHVNALDHIGPLDVEPGDDAWRRGRHDYIFCHLRCCDRTPFEILHSAASSKGASLPALPTRRLRINFR